MDTETHRTTAIETTTAAVLTVPEAGQILGIGRAASYAAAKRGEIPTIRIGGRIVVPTAALRRLLAIDDTPPTAS